MFILCMFLKWVEKTVLLPKDELYVCRKNIKNKGIIVLSLLEASPF